jgi:methylenetetrahydrofolate reductase (NADPH)
MNAIATEPRAVRHYGRDELIHAIIAFVDDYSIEASPRDRDRVAGLHSLLGAGTEVYVAHPPSVTLDEVVDTAAQVQGAGFRAVPHLLARRLSGRQQLAAALKRLRGAGVERVLALAGDDHRCAGPFGQTLDVLETGLLEANGFTAVGFAGHPEGIRGIDPDVLEAALAKKAACARRSGLAPYLVTQFGFDAQALFDWEAATSGRCAALPIRAGLAGPTRLPQLLRFAVRCGIGESLSLLRKRTSALAGLATTATPATLIAACARHRLSHPDSHITGAHFFSFGGLETTAKWVEALRKGNLTLHADGDSFEVHA